VSNDKSCDSQRHSFFDEKSQDKYFDKYSPYLFIMTIKSFIFHAARVCGTRGKMTENLRGPIVNADPHSVCILEAPGAMPRYRAFGIPRFSIASGRYKYTSCVLSVLFLGPRSPTLSATTMSLLLPSPPSRARRISLLRNYFRMIPIAGQIKTPFGITCRSRSLVCETELREDTSAI